MSAKFGPGGIPARELLGRPGPRMSTVITSVVVTIIVLVIIVLFLSGSTVQAGNVGVVTTFGQVSLEALRPGFHLIVPIAQRINQIDVRVRPHTFNQIDAASQELQTVQLSGTMNYHLNPDRAVDLFQTVGLDFDSKVIDPAFADFIKEVVPQYPVNQILAKREELRGRAQQKLGENLQRYGIIVDDIYISNIAFSKEFQSAIELKQTTQQSVETERQILLQRQVQAEQAVAQAEGEARAQIARARGEAEANRARSEQLNPQLIDYLRWTRWDGRLPMVTGGGNTLLEIPIPGANSAPVATASPVPTPTSSAPRPQATPSPPPR